MNGAIATYPNTDPSHWADAVCAIGTGPKLTTGSGDENNTFGCGTLITTNVIMVALHSMPYGLQASGSYYQSGYVDIETNLTDPNSRAVRFRRKADGTDPCGGVVVDYWQTKITGYWVPSPVRDIAYAYLATAVPAAVATPLEISASCTAGDTCIVAGWGLNGSTINTGTLPGDCGLISGRTVGTVGSNGFIFDATGPDFDINVYDSGGACVKDFSGTKKLIGVIGGSQDIVRLAYYQSDPTFQIPGFYIPGTPPAGFDVPTSWVLPELDTFLELNTPTSNFSTEAILNIGETTGKGANNYCAILTFDVSGITPIAASLKFFHTGLVSSASDIRVRRLRRTVTSLANWNTYNGSAAWTTAGGFDTTNDVFTANQFTVSLGAPAGADEEASLGGSELLAMVELAKADDGILRLHLSGVTPDLLTSFHSSEASEAGVRPYLELTTVAGAANSPSRSRMRGRGRGKTLIL